MAAVSKQTRRLRRWMRSRATKLHHQTGKPFGQCLERVRKREIIHWVHDRWDQKGNVPLNRISRETGVPLTATRRIVTRLLQAAKRAEARVDG